MASDLPALWIATYNRINGDTGSGGFRNVTTPLITAVYNTRPPVATDAAIYPYIVYSTFESENQSEFRTRVWYRKIRFDVFIQNDPNSTIDVMARGADILRRLEGDWEDQAAGTAPTYGFDRYQPTLTGSGWTADIFQLVNSEDDHDEDLWHWYMTFDIRTSKAGA